MPEEQEFEIIPVTLAATSMLKQVIDWRNFFLTLAVEHAAKTDGIDMRQGWRIDLQTGTWRKPKPQVTDNATGRNEDKSESESRQPHSG